MISLICVNQKEDKTKHTKKQTNQYREQTDVCQRKQGRERME